MRKQRRIKIAVQGKAEADALYTFLTKREETYAHLYPDFISASGPMRRKGTKELYDLSITLPHLKEGADND